MNHGIKKHVSLDLISLEKFILILYLHLAVESKVGKKLYNQLDRKYMTRVPTVDNQGGKKAIFCYRKMALLFAATAFKPRSPKT